MAKSSSETSPTRQIDFDSCGGFTVATAAKVLAIPADQIADHSEQLDWGKQCSFAPRNDASAQDSVSFLLSRDDSVDAATLAFAQLRDHAGIADATIANQASHAVQGLGDEALWVAANDSLYVRVGDVTVTITLPNDEARQIKVARALLE
jgi:hypothetical protein